MATCGVDGCDKRARGRFCSGHAERKRLYGDVMADVPLRPTRPSGLSQLETFRHFMPSDPPESGCWLWAGTTNAFGYGVIETYSGGVRIRRRAHVISYENFVGPIADRAIIRHTCDTPACCQPKHLLPGTRSDNSRDKVERDRQSRKLDRGQVIRMRELREKGVSVKELAKLFDVSNPAVEAVIYRRNWKHI